MPAPTGPQFVTVYHASSNDVPAHMAPYTSINKTDYSNVHDDVIHAGSLDAITGSQLIGARKFRHAYDVPVEQTYPVTFGDEQKYLDNPDREQKLGNKIKEKGTQEGLFEATPADPNLAVTTNMAVPYRNRAEGIGSISYMLPKKAINEGKIVYRGVENAY